MISCDDFYFLSSNGICKKIYWSRISNTIVNESIIPKDMLESIQPKTIEDKLMSDYMQKKVLRKKLIGLESRIIRLKKSKKGSIVKGKE